MLLPSLHLIHSVADGAGAGGIIGITSGAGRVDGRDEIEGADEGELDGILLGFDDGIFDKDGILVALRHGN